MKTHTPTILCTGDHEWRITDQIQHFREDGTLDQSITVSLAGPYSYQWMARVIYWLRYK